MHLLQPPESLHILKLLNEEIASKGFIGLTQLKKRFFDKDACMLSWFEQRH